MRIQAYRPQIFLTDFTTASLAVPLDLATPGVGQYYIGPFFTLGASFLKLYLLGSAAVGAPGHTFSWEINADYGTVSTGTGAQTWYSAGSANVPGTSANLTVATVPAANDPLQTGATASVCVGTGSACPFLLPTWMRFGINKTAITANGFTLNRIGVEIGYESDAEAKRPDGAGRTNNGSLTYNPVLPLPYAGN